MVDAIIVGAGVLGTFHAYHLALKGYKVIVFEKDIQPREATVRNFGQVVPSGFPIGRWHEYGKYSTKLYKELQSKTDIGIRNNGSLYIASDSSEMDVLEEMSQKFAETGYASELFSKNQVLNYSDRFKADYVFGGLFFEQEVSAEPRKMIFALQNYLSAQYSIEFRYQSAVVNVEPSGNGTKVSLANGEVYNAQKTFICNGRDFNFLFPTLFKSANIEISKLQMMATKPVNFDLKGNILTGLSIRRYESFKTCNAYERLNPLNAHAELQELGIHLLFKQRVDGSIIIGDSHVYADAAIGFDTGFDESQLINDKILAEAKRILTIPEIEIAEVWSGYYSQMKGGEEIFEYSIDDCIYISTAIGGKGMTASAGYAKEQIDIIYG